MTTLPTTKHALVIQGTEKEKQQACIEIRDWAVKNNIPMYWEFEKEPWNPVIPCIVWHPLLMGGITTMLLREPILNIDSSFTIHHTVDSFKKVFEVEESEPTNLPIEFVEWYSGMTREKILKAVERWKRESTIQEFKPIELTNLKN